MTQQLSEFCPQTAEASPGRPRAQQGYLDPSANPGALGGISLHVVQAGFLDREALSLLQVIVAHGQIPPSEIVEALQVHPSLVTRQVRDLEADG